MELDNSNKAKDGFHDIYHKNTYLGLKMERRSPPSRKLPLFFKLPRLESLPPNTQKQSKKTKQMAHR